MTLIPVSRFFTRALGCGLFAACLSAGTLEASRSIADMPATIEPIHAPFPMPALQRPAIRDQRFDIRDFGARTMAEDAAFMNTDAIHRAIEAAHRAGGGTVVIPAGDWLTGPLHLKSNLNLHLAEGAVVRFSENKEDYLPVVIQRHEGVEAYNYSPLIYAFELENVALTGAGRFDGQGEHWWSWYRQFGPPSRAIASKSPLSRRDFGKGAGREGMRPNFAVFWRCRNVLLEGVTFDDSPMWNVHLVYTEDAIVRGVTINSLEAPNGDGVVVDSSRNVLVEYNHFETGDDAVVIKSGLNEDGLAINIPTENVVVRNFTASKVRTGSGGVVFGSETSGGIRNVYVHDAVFDGSDRGIRFKTERGRGNVTENIYVENIRMRNVTYEAINFNTYYSGPGRIGPAPLIRNIQIRNIEIDGVPRAISLIGLPEKWLEDVVLENIRVTNAKIGARFNRVKNLTLRNVHIESEERAVVFQDSYEIRLSGLSLSDAADGPPILFSHGYLGALDLGDVDPSLAELGPGVPATLLTEGVSEQRW
jgi:hypothetical protein